MDVQVAAAEVSIKWLKPITELNQINLVYSGQFRITIVWFDFFLFKLFYLKILRFIYSKNQLVFFPFTPHIKVACNY